MNDFIHSGDYLAAFGETEGTIPERWTRLLERESPGLLESVTGFGPEGALPHAARAFHRQHHAPGVTQRPDTLG